MITRMQLQRLVERVVDEALTGVELSDDPAQDLTDKVLAHMAQHNEKSFARALVPVAKANPELHRQYLDQA